MNATYLFERPIPRQDNAVQGLPHSSEHFWTSVFALFLLHLGKNEQGGLHVWQLMTPPMPPRYFKAHQDIGGFEVCGLTFENIAIEPSSLSNIWFGHEVRLPIEISGLSPDLVIRDMRSAGKKTFTFIENKTVGASLSSRQRSNYATLLRELKKLDVQCRLFVLCSTGDSSAYAACQELNSAVDPRVFGLLLWEDVFREMKRFGFSLTGLAISHWADTFTDDLDRDAVVPENWPFDVSNVPPRQARSRALGSK